MGLRRVNPINPQCGYIKNVNKRFIFTADFPTGMLPSIAMTNTDVLRYLALDHSLIREAIRRLIDGTCCLKGEERDYIQDLFENMNQALIEHIDLEEKFFFPEFDSQGAIRMKMEHSRIRLLVEEARHCIHRERAVAFKVLLSELRQSLKNHEKIEGLFLESQRPIQIEDESLYSIEKRVIRKVI